MLGSVDSRSMHSAPTRNLITKKEKRHRSTSDDIPDLDQSKNPGNPGKMGAPARDFGAELKIGPNPNIWGKNNPGVYNPAQQYSFVGHQDEGPRDHPASPGKHRAAPRRPEDPHGTVARHLRHAGDGAAGGRAPGSRGYARRLLDTFHPGWRQVRRRLCS
jgi:hypothetical protein